MYIDPNSVIRIVKGCPLNNTYQHTIYFTDTISQFNYFADLTKYIITGHTFQRHTQNAVKVQKPIGDLYDCNYLMFTNPAFANKWFYAFITNVEYINNNTSIIYYQLDVMQSWFFDYELLPSFVIREHSETDVIGENTVPEGLEHGEYITTSTKSFLATDYRIGILATEQNPNPDTPMATVFQPPNKVCGYPINCYWWFSAFRYDNVTSLQQVQQILDSFATAGKSDAIISMFIFPYSLAGQHELFSRSFIGAERKLSKKPRNNKLYTFPYCVQTAICDGTAVNLHYELFNTQTPTYNIFSTWGVNPKSIMIPTSYQGYNKDYTHALTLSGFPLLPYIRDYFQNYIGQNKANLIYGTVKDVVGAASGAVNAISGNVGGIAQIGSSADSLISRGIELYQHSIVPDSFIGGNEAGDVMTFSGQKGYYTYCRSIKPEYVDILDGYFDKFGYKTNRNKIPNTHSRPHWNYVQTGDCTIKGNLPQADIDIICSIYNTGITFWKNGNEVGNYNLDNTVKGGV